MGRLLARNGGGGASHRIVGTPRSEKTARLRCLVHVPGRARRVFQLYLGVKEKDNGVIFLAMRPRKHHNREGADVADFLVLPPVI